MIKVILKNIKDKYVILSLLIILINTFLIQKASIISGFGNSLCWYVLGVYITLLSKSYAELNSVPFPEIQTLFFGINGAIFMLCKLKFILNSTLKY